MKTRVKEYHDKHLHAWIDEICDPFKNGVTHTYGCDYHKFPVIHGGGGPAHSLEEAIKGYHRILINHGVSIHKQTTIFDYLNQD